MFFYQAVIMLLVVGIVFVLAFVIKLKNRSILAVSIVALVLIGSFSLSLIQDYFGVQYYTQKTDISYYSKLRLTESQKSNLGGILKGYKNISSTQDHYRAAYEKTFHVQQGKLNSTIQVEVLLYRSKNEADEYFRTRQRYYYDDNVKIVLPSDPSKSDKLTDPNFHYITSYIRSCYENVNDIMYVPSRIYYVSEVLIQDGDMVIDLNERTNRPSTAKNQVMSELTAAFAKNP